MLIGVNSFETRLDLIDWNEFRKWNGAKVGLDGKLMGGEPVFAGRNFVAGDFIWAHAEATDTMKNPSPENLPAINVSVPLIAPIQAPIAIHQQARLSRGILSGRIDAYATCLKIYRSVAAGEFAFTSTRQVNVWLAVDPDVFLSAEYWAGWSHTVNTFTAIDAGAIESAAVAPPAQPFRACVICRYTKVGGKFRRDPQVAAALSVAAFIPGLATTCFAFWADAPDPDEDGVRPNPVLDFNQFDSAELPEIWRFSKSFRDADGGPAVVDYSLDVVREPDPHSFDRTVTVFMLRVQKWQPNVPDIARLGFVVYLDAGITNQQIADMQAHPYPNLNDISGHFGIAEGGVMAVGRYLKTPGQGNNMSRDEVERLSNGGFEIFTVWESFNVLAEGEPTMNDPPPAVQHTFKVGINYFDPTIHAGTEDGRNAFTYCGDVLRQPPHTPVFFCVDFDAADPHDTAPVSAEDSKKRIRDYLTLVKAERDRYAQTNPGRYYTIGLYSNGGVARWAYDQGIVSSFWQSVSTGSTGNTPPNRPWFHANRWQFNKETGLQPHWPFVPGADPDADWGDGGTWTLIDPLARELSDLEDQEVRQFIQTFLPVFSGLLL
jgi:hypothetical protein